MRAENRHAVHAILGFSFSIVAAISFAATIAEQSTPDKVPIFDVASVKPSASQIAGQGGGRKGPPPFTIGPKQLAARGLTLKRLISHAYSVEDSLILGGPVWTENERYDIDAKTESPATREEMMLMLRTLLADRYHLKFHRESKAVPQNVLVVAKNGPKYGPRFHLAQDGVPPPALDKRSVGQIPLKGKTMKDFAFFLTDNQHMWDPDADDGAGPPVLDQTGLAGVYDIVMSSASRRDWLAVFEQDLGLKVEMRKIPSAIFVIESATRPTSN